MIEPKIPLWGLITFLVFNISSFAWAFIKIYFKQHENEKEIRNLKTNQEILKQENEELKKLVQEVKENLIAVKTNTELLMLGRIKTQEK